MAQSTCPKSRGALSPISWRTAPPQSNLWTFPAAAPAGGRQPPAAVLESSAIARMRHNLSALMEESKARHLPTNLKQLRGSN